MASLVAIEFLVSWAGLDETDSKVMQRAQMALEVASGAVRAECGWGILVEDLVGTFYPDPFGSVWLPSKHVQHVESVSDDSGVLLEAFYRWTPDGRITRTRGFWPGPVTVAYRSGWSAVPDGVRGVVLNVANRLMQASETGTAGELKSITETVGGVSQSKTFAVQSGASTGGLMTPADLNVLAPYKLTYAV